jgi:hypothetical protein
MGYVRTYSPDALAFETRNVKCATNAIGVKGAGEAGAIGSCPVVINAVVDALWCAYGFRRLDMPAASERVWQAIAERGACTRCETHSSIHAVVIACRRFGITGGPGRSFVGCRPQIREGEDG